MPVNIPVKYPSDSTPNIMPSASSENDWASQLVMFQQTLTAAVNAALAGGGDVTALTAWAEQLALSCQPVVYPSLLESAISLQVTDGSSIDNDASSIYVTPFPLGTSIVAGAPSLAAGTQGQMVLIICDPTQTMPANLILQDERFLTGSTLKIPTGEIILTPGDSILFKYNATTELWYEMGRSSLPRWAADCSSSSQPLNVITGTEAANDITVADGATITGDTSTMYLTPTPTNTDVILGIPSIAGNLINGTGGTTVMFINDPTNGNTGSITFKDNATLSGSKLRLTTTQCVLTPGSSITMKYQSATDTWYEVARAVLV